MTPWRRSRSPAGEIRVPFLRVCSKDGTRDMRVRTIMCAIATVCGIGCVSSPPAGLPDFMESRDVPAGMGVLCVYRPAQHFGSVNPMPIFREQDLAAELSSGTCIELAVYPGNRTIRASLMGAKSPVVDGALTLVVRGRRTGSPPVPERPSPQMFPKKSTSF